MSQRSLLDLIRLVSNAILSLCSTWMKCSENELSDKITRSTAIQCLIEYWRFAASFINRNDVQQVLEQLYAVMNCPNVMKHAQRSMALSCLSPFTRESEYRKDIRLGFHQSVHPFFYTMESIQWRSSKNCVLLVKSMIQLCLVSHLWCLFVLWRTVHLPSFMMLVLWLNLFVFLISRLSWLVTLIDSLFLPMVVWVSRLHWPIRLPKDLYKLIRILSLQTLFNTFLPLFRILSLK